MRLTSIQVPPLAPEEVTVTSSGASGVTSIGASLMGASSVA